VLNGGDTNTGDQRAKANGLIPAEGKAIEKDPEIRKSAFEDKKKGGVEEEFTAKSRSRGKRAGGVIS